MARPAPPRSPPTPPASITEGAAHARDHVVKLYDRQDGQGVEWRVIAETLFRASFDVLDRLPEDQRQAIARRVHEASYKRITNDLSQDATVPRDGSAPALTANLNPSPPHPH